MRREFIEPSIGSTITRHGELPSPNATSPRSSEIAVKSAAGRVQLLELGEDRVLAAAVERQRVVAALADSLVDGAVRRSSASSANSSLLRRDGVSHRAYEVVSSIGRVTVDNGPPQMRQVG